MDKEIIIEPYNLNWHKKEFMKEKKQFILLLKKNISLAEGRLD